MKNRFLKGIAALLMMVGLAACGGNNGGSPEEAKVKVYLSVSNLEMERFDNYRIIYDVVGTEEALTWTTSDTEIASIVDDGLVSAHNAGECVITASVSGVSATCKVTVNPNTSSPILHIEKLSVSLLSDSEAYENEMYVTYKQSLVDDVTYRFNYYDVPNDVVSCAYNEGYMVITPLKAGETVVTVSAITMGTVAVQTVTVTVDQA